MARSKRPCFSKLERFASRSLFAETYLLGKDKAPWRMRNYQVASIESPVKRKCHCDGRDVGKTSEIEIMAAWASGSMLIATMFDSHLNPLMRRLYDLFDNNPQLKRNVRALRMAPGWHFTFRNGFEIFGRIAGPNGVNFQGMHTDWQIVDEAQNLSTRAWEELLPALNAGGTRWVYGVPNGVRNKFYEISKEPTWEQYLWPSRLNPGFTEERNAELLRFYGGGDAPGYVHNVLGLHGAPEACLFDISKFERTAGASDYCLVNAANRMDAYKCRCVAKGPLVLGVDTGFATDPTEMCVWTREKNGHCWALGRLHCAKVEYPEQAELIRQLDAINQFDGIAIDDGAAGIALIQDLACSDRMASKVIPISFGGRLTWQPHGVVWPMTRPTKEILTGLLSRNLTAGRLHGGPAADRMAQYAAQTAQYSRSGRVVYSKGNDHIIDADRCAFAALYREELSVAEPGVEAALPTRIEAF
ncbi:MAG: hypothetical protein NTU83_04420 [Candidatus Hydrogenedentes bacterium]|nr:hypothetical protein [Candidatus Hydrogenedentota bacterium]